MIIIIADVGEVATLLEMDESRAPEIVMPQTSGPCVHYDERSEHVADVAPCTYSYDDGRCPHLDNPEILCPVKDACAAMREIARMRDACEAEQEEQDTDMADVAPSQTYETAAPEGVEPEPDDGALHAYTVPATRKPTNPNAWSDEEIEVIRRAQSADEAGRLYSETYGIRKRSRSAIMSRWYKLRAAGELIAPAPTPDFAGDTAPVTQCDEAAIRRPRFQAGDRVRISHPTYKGYTGTIRRYYSATANYLTYIDGTTDTMWLSEEYLEAA